MMTCATSFELFRLSPVTAWVVGGWGVGGRDVINDSADIFQSFLRETVVSSSGLGMVTDLYLMPQT